MLNPNFDPYNTLMEISNNLNTLIQAHNALAHKVEEQAHTIDLLVQGLTNANKANEIVMNDMMTLMNQRIKELK